MLTVAPGDGSGHEGGKDHAPSLIDEIVREGVRRMLAEALQAEVDAYIAGFADEWDDNGRRLVVRNGYVDAAVDDRDQVVVRHRVENVAGHRLSTHEKITSASSAAFSPSSARRLLHPPVLPGWRP